MKSTHMDMKRVRNKNKEISERLKSIEENIDFNTLEEDVLHKRIEEFNLRRKWWSCSADYINNVSIFYQINGELIERNDILKRRFLELTAWKNFIYDITEMKAPINQSNPLILEYYKELEEKYGNSMATNITSGLRSGKLNLMNLDDESRHRAFVLTIYIQFFMLTNVIRRTIDFIDVI